MSRTIIAIIGQAEPCSSIDDLAYGVGRLLALQGWSIVNGGRTGVMEASAHGFQDGKKTLPVERHGTVIGILPSTDGSEANSFLDIVIATGMDEARNTIIINSAVAVVAIGKGYGTLNEIALALRAKKAVVALKSWEGIDPAIREVATPEEAVGVLQECLAASDNSSVEVNRARP